jgi:hypothetical protein
MQTCRPSLRSVLRRQSQLSLTPVNIHPVLASSHSLKLRCLRDHELAKYEIAELL